MKIDGKVLLFICAIISCSALTSFGSHFAAMGSSFGILAFDASLLISVKLAGNTMSKLVFGSLNDKIGAKKTSICVVSIVVLATGALFFRNQYFLIVAAFFFGAVGMISATQFPVIARTLWKKDEYPSILQVLAMTLSIFYSLFTSVYGFLYDAWKDYGKILYFVLAFSVVLASMMVLLFRDNKDE